MVRDLLRPGLPRHDRVWFPSDRASAELPGVGHRGPSGNIRAAYQCHNLCYNLAPLGIERFSGRSDEAFLHAVLIRLPCRSELTEASAHTVESGAPRIPPGRNPAHDCKAATASTDRPKPRRCSDALAA
jgi:hypothetical protein